MKIVFDQRSSRSADLERLKELGSKLADAEGVPGNAELSVVLTDNAEMQEFNQRFMGEDKPTDVLSLPLFPNLEQMSRQPPEIPLLLGDVIISLEQAEKQGQENGRGGSDETAMLLVHGMLHLLGYDHADTIEGERMFARQARFLETA